MMIVPDFSHHNYNDSLVKAYLENTDTSVIIFKATEGMSYKDERTQDMLTMFLLNMDKKFEDTGNVIVGLYHYCRLDKKDYIDTARERALKESKWFCHVVRLLRAYVLRSFPRLNVHFVPIIDWEGENVGQPKREEYLCEFVGNIYAEFGTAPIIYISGGFTNARECKAVKEKYPDVPVWVAHYGVNTPRIGTWNSWLGWQFTSTPLDLSFIRAELFDAYRVKIWGADT